MKPDYDQLRTIAIERTTPKPRQRIPIKGSWLNLRGIEIMQAIQPVWASFCTGKMIPIEHGTERTVPGEDRKRSLDSLATETEALLSWWNWVGGTPGDACQTHIVFLSSEYTIGTYTVDSCWMPGLDLEIWGNPPRAILSALIEAIGSLPGKPPRN